MPNELIIEEPIIETTTDRFNFGQYGFHSADSSKSAPDSIVGYLNKAYDAFLTEQRLDAKGLKDRISRLRAEIDIEKAQLNDKLAERSSTKMSKEDKEKEIENLELEIIDIREGDAEPGSTSNFIIGAFITFLLTLYLFVFYSSSGYSAFYGVKPGSIGIINPNVFAEATNKGGGVIALIILFPVIFLGLGFLIHESIETNKKLVQDKKPRKFAIIITLLFITLIADAFIGYKISQGLHNIEFNARLTNEIWKTSMAFYDINFYLVLILGFVVYVIWGFLLNYVLSHPYLKTDSERVKLQVQNINNKISERRNELSIIITLIHTLESAINTISTKIQNKENDIIGFQNGFIPINVDTLRGCIGEFMGGWQGFTLGYHSQPLATELNSDAINRQNIWLENKISQLKSLNRHE